MMNPTTDTSNRPVRAMRARLSIRVSRVELLICLAIAAALIAVVVPSLKHARAPVESRARTQADRPWLPASHPSPRVSVRLIS
jgi:hypothetical protein